MAGAPFQGGRKAMEKIHEGDFEKDRHRNLDRCMCDADFQLV
jgi:hypothetical protein